MPLVAELGDDLLLPGLRHQGANLVDRVGQGLLAVDMLAEPQGRHAGDGMGVIGSRDRHHIGLLAHLVEHPAEVLELRRLGEAFERARRSAIIHIAETDDVVAA